MISIECNRIQQNPFFLITSSSVAVSHSGMFSWKFGVRYHKSKINAKHCCMNVMNTGWSWAWSQFPSPFPSFTSDHSVLFLKTKTPALEKPDGQRKKWFLSHQYNTTTATCSIIKTISVKLWCKNSSLLSYVHFHVILCYKGHKP